MPTRVVNHEGRTLEETDMLPIDPSDCPNGPQRRFPDRRSSSDRQNERREIQKQINHLTRFPEDKPRQRKVLKRLASGRQAGLPPFAKLANGRVPALAAHEFLVRNADLERRDVQKAIKIFRLPLEQIEGLEVLRLRPRGRFRPLKFRVEAFLLRKFESPVRPNYLVHLGGWSKAEGGPEPTAGRPELGAAGNTRVRVAVIDTGLGLRTDGWLQGLTNPAPDPLYSNPYTFTLGLAGGHGTFVAGIVQRVEPSTDIRIYGGCTIGGVGTDDEVGRKITQAALEGADIINLSLGTRTPGDVPPYGMESGIRQAIAHNPNILVVCAAGNYGDTRKVWPAAFSQTFSRNVVAVSGLNPLAGVPNPEWTSHGDWVQISTIAEGIVSTYVKGTEDTVVENPPDTFEINDFAIWTGTSFAAPQVAGAVASICLTNEVAPTDAIDILKARGTEIPGYGKAVPILPGT